MIKKAKHRLLKSLEAEIEKIGPMKCLIYGVVLTGLNVYFRYYKTGAEVTDGNYWHALGRFLIFTPMGALADLCLLGGGYVEGKRIVKKIKDKFYKS